VELAKEEFGISVLQIKEIMKMQPITVVPQTPHFVQGVINLRGRIVPVIDLRRKMNMQEQEYTELTCIVVARVQVDAGEQAMGLVVDGVVEVVTLSHEEIEGAPEFGQDSAPSYISGMAKGNGKVKTLIDIDQVLNTRQLSSIAMMVE